MKVLVVKEPKDPHQISIDNSGYVYLTDKNSHQIIKFDWNGKFVKVLGTEDQTLVSFIDHMVSFLIPKIICI